MRAATTELAVTTSLAAGLPAAFLGASGSPGAGSFPAAFVGAFDAVLAPAVATIESGEAYYDPGTTPEDFLAWLATWVGLPADGTCSAADLRRRIGAAARVYAELGTVGGIAKAVGLVVGVRAEVSDSGGAAWSARPGAELPGSPRAEVEVRVPAGSDVAAVERVVSWAKPAHVQARVTGNLE